MDRPKLTIGMATFDDYHGVYFSLQALRMYHDLRDVELLVVDNNPASAHGSSTKNLVENWAHGGTKGARYIPMADTIGTTAPRQRIFDEARGEWVLCMDSHVLLVPDAIRKLLIYTALNPESGDLLHGPLLYDDLVSYSSHFDDVWRSEMWGTWGRDERAADPNGEPFEIPGQGLGLFVCRKDAWLGFNPHFRGFGGEEMYIHTKFRQAGRKVLCLPFLRWGHRFGRPDGVRYPLTRWGKVRNYVLGHLELGLPLDRVYEHFVTGNLMTEAEWKLLLADPVGAERQPATITAGGNKAAAPSSLNMLVDWTKANPRDLEKHADKLRELTADAQHVTALVKRQEWNVFLAAGRPETLIVYNLEDGPLHPAVHRAIKAEQDRGEGRFTSTYTTVNGPAADSLTIAPIAQTDLLVIDTIHQADRLYAELQRHGHRVRQRILIRATGAFGEAGEGGGPGLFPAMRRWMRENPEWSVVWHTREQYGMTLLSRLPKDKPTIPSKVQMAKNFAASVADHVADGLKTVTAEQLEERLLVCTICEYRAAEDRCSVCGCGLAKKASWRSSECPLGKWPALPADEPRSE